MRDHGRWGDVHARIGAGCESYGVGVDRCVCAGVEGGEGGCCCGEERDEKSGWMHGDWVCVVRLVDAEAKVWIAKENVYRENKTEINSVIIQ